MIKTKDSFKEFVREIVGIIKRDTKELEKGKTFQKDPGLPIYPFIMTGIAIYSLSSSMNMRLNLGLYLLFSFFIVLHYGSLWVFAKSEYIDMLERKNVTNNLVTTSFIFRKILEQSFLCVFIASLVFLYVPSIVQVLIFAFILRYIMWCTMTILLNNTCEKCNALWSYELQDCRNIKSNQESQCKVTKNINNKWIIPNIIAGALSKCLECENCGHKVKA